MSGTANDPTAAVRDGARTIFHEQHAAMREIVRELSDEALNWKPASHGDVNSIAQMLSHADHPVPHCVLNRARSNRESVEFMPEHDRAVPFRFESIDKREGFGFRFIQKQQRPFLCRRDDIQVPRSSGRHSTFDSHDGQSAALRQRSRLQAEAETAQVICRALLVRAPAPVPHRTYQLGRVHPPPVVDDRDIGLGVRGKTHPDVCAACRDAVVDEIR